MKARRRTEVGSLRIRQQRRERKNRLKRRIKAHDRRAYDALARTYPMPGETPAQARQRKAGFMGNHRSGYFMHFAYRAWRQPDPHSPCQQVSRHVSCTSRPRGAGRPRACVSRSASRGGDSGDDGSGPSDPEPASARRFGRRAGRGVPAVRVRVGRAGL